MEYSGKRIEEGENDSEFHSHAARVSVAHSFLTAKCMQISNTESPSVSRVKARESSLGDHQATCEHTSMYTRGYSWRGQRARRNEQNASIGQGGEEKGCEESQEAGGNRFKLPSTSHSWFQLRGFVYFLFGFRGPAVHYTLARHRCRMQCITGKGGKKGRRKTMPPLDYQWQGKFRLVPYLLLSSPLKVPAITLIAHFQLLFVPRCGATRVH